MEDRPSGNGPRLQRCEVADRPLWQAWHVSGAGRQMLLAVAVAAVAFGARLALDPWLGNRQPFTPAFAGIGIVAWFASWRAGLPTTVICQLLSKYFFIAPRYSFALNAEEFIGTGSYYLIAGVILCFSATPPPTPTGPFPTWWQGCARSTSARPNSWPCSAMSCAIRWGPCAPVWTC
jgi:hypothetical protein